MKNNSKNEPKGIALSTFGDQFWMFLSLGVRWGRLGSLLGHCLANVQKNETFGDPLGRLLAPFGGHWVAFGIPWGAFR